MKIGLVLSGGGARGFAHLGVLQAFDELGIHVDAISGTSAGAVVGAFYFSGHKAADTLRLISSYKIYQWARPTWRKPGFLNMDKIAKLFSAYLPKTFEELDRPLTVAVTDILQGESLFINSGELVPAICGSSCIPILFNPVKFNGRELVDGGVMNNFPVEPLLDKAANIIGVHVNPVVHGIQHVAMKNMADRNVILMLQREVNEKKDKCTIFIEPAECGNYNMMDLGAGEKIFKCGYDAAMAVKEKLLLLQ
ncbi:MAG: patatin-like phospholipase family protein [Bacteroidia bacterium]